MSFQCANCRKVPSDATTWEKITEWLMYHLFSKAVTNLTQEKFTQGFGSGYQRGYSHCLTQQQTREEVMAQIVKEGMGGMFEKFEEKKV